MCPSGEAPGFYLFVFFYPPHIVCATGSICQLFSGTWRELCPFANLENQLLEALYYSGQSSRAPGKGLDTFWLFYSLLNLLPSSSFLPLSPLVTCRSSCKCFYDKNTWPVSWRWQVCSQWDGARRMQMCVVGTVLHKGRKSCLTRQGYQHCLWMESEKLGKGKTQWTGDACKVDKFLDLCRIVIRSCHLGK